MKKIKNPHDRFIKALMNDRSIALEYFKNFLPPEIVQNIDLDSIHVADTSYIDENLSELFSDIVFHASLKNTEEELKICILIEHKSFIDIHTVFQILHYMSSAWMKAIKNKEEPKLIIPILFYHGKEKWDYSRLNDHFRKLPQQCKKFLPDFEFVFSNLQEMTDDQIKVLENQLLSASFLSMKHYFESAWLEANLAELFSAISDEHRNLNQQYLVYLLNFVMLDIEKMKQITSNLSSAKTAVIMNTIDLLRQEGIEIGMEKGIEKGIEIGIEKDKELIVCNAFKNNISLFMIANITQLSESQVMDILKKFELV